MPCPMCVARGKTWNGDDPKCAFEDPNRFSSENWMCATMNALRQFVVDKTVWNEDCNCAVLPVFDCGEYLVLSWYKSRGRTDGAWIVSEDKMTPLTLEEAEVIANQYKYNKKLRGFSRPDPKEEVTT